MYLKKNGREHSHLQYHSLKIQKGFSWAGTVQCVGIQVRLARTQLLKDIF